MENEGRKNRLFGIIEELIIARIRFDKGEIRWMDYYAEVETLQREFRQIVDEMYGELKERIERLESLPHNRPKGILTF